MKFGDYELTCYECSGTEFEARMDRRSKYRVGRKQQEQHQQYWVMLFVCKTCKVWRAMTYRVEPSILKLRKLNVTDMEAVKLSRDVVADQRRTWENETVKAHARARIFLMRHGNSPRNFAQWSGGMTVDAAREFMLVAQRSINRYDAKRQGLKREELERKYRDEAIAFYTSIIQDPAAWERDPKTVMQARRELSALQGIAGDTGQVNLNLTDNRSQVTVYQLALPDDGRTRLPPKDDVKVIECQPNNQQ